MRKEINSDEIKDIQLNILNSIHRFCIENKIRYSLSFGSLLGAIRHKGYIPWDDDIDIMMPRPDYDKFVSKYEDVKNHLRVQTHKNDDSYYLSFAKVYNVRTEQIIFPTKTGVFVDIFPIEGLPETEDETKEYMDEYFKCVFHDILYTCKNNAYRPGNKIFNSLKYLIKRIMYPSRKKGIKKLDALISKYPYETSNKAGYVHDVFGMKGFMNKSIFEKYILVPFEGKEYYAIADYDTFLRLTYGDYMQLPPEDQRVPGHSAPVYWKD